MFDDGKDFDDLKNVVLSEYRERVDGDYHVKRVEIFFDFMLKPALTKLSIDEFMDIRSTFNLRTIRSISSSVVSQMASPSAATEYLRMLPMGSPVDSEPVKARLSLLSIEYHESMMEKVSRAMKEKMSESSLRVAV